MVLVLLLAEPHLVSSSIEDIDKMSWNSLKDLGIGQWPMVYTHNAATAYFNGADQNSEYPPPSFPISLDVYPRRPTPRRIFESAPRARGPALSDTLGGAEQTPPPPFTALSQFLTRQILMANRCGK